MLAGVMYVIIELLGRWLNGWGSGVAYILILNWNYALIKLIGTGVIYGTNIALKSALSRWLFPQFIYIW